MSSTKRIPLGTYLPFTSDGDYAAMYYADLLLEGEEEGGFYGFVKKAGGYLGGSFASLWTPDTAIETIINLSTAGIGTGATAATRGSQAAAFGFRRFFYNGTKETFKKTFQETSRLYWGARAGGARGARATLHHWLFPQRWARSNGGLIPDGLVNAGWNILELKNYTNRFWYRKLIHRKLGLNTYMGFAPKWGRKQLRHVIKAHCLEWGIRIGILGSPIAGTAIGWYIGVEMEDD